MPRFVLKCFRVSLGCGLLISGTTLAEWDLVWSDEFDGNGELDQSKWNFESFEPGANNNELQEKQADHGGRGFPSHEDLTI